MFRTHTFEILWNRLHSTHHLSEDVSIWILRCNTQIIYITLILRAGLARAWHTKHKKGSKWKFIYPAMLIFLYNLFPLYFQSCIMVLMLVWYSQLSLTSLKDSKLNQTKKIKVFILYLQTFFLRVDAVFLDHLSQDIKGTNSSAVWRSVNHLLHSSGFSYPKSTKFCACLRMLMIMSCYTFQIIPNFYMISYNKKIFSIS